MQFISIKSGTWHTFNCLSNETLKHLTVIKHIHYHIYSISNNAHSGNGNVEYEFSLAG